MGTRDITQDYHDLDDPIFVPLDQRDLMSIAKGVKERSREAVPRLFVMFAARHPLRDQVTMKLPRFVLTLQ